MCAYEQFQNRLSACAHRIKSHTKINYSLTDDLFGFLFIVGANGHIGYLFLPRGIRFVYTMAGAFYPNWKPNQRIGVKIDIPVKQTVEDVSAGEDMWIRNAIEYIESK